MRLIESECCGPFAIYGRLEPVFLNCYRRHSSLVLHNGDGTTNIIHIREGVKHELPLDMAAFGIGVL